MLRSSSSGRWRPLSQQEASQKRAHQKTLLEAVKLLSSLLSSLQSAELTPDSAPLFPNLAVALSSTASKHLAQSMPARAAPNSPLGETGAFCAKAATSRADSRMPNQKNPEQRVLGQIEALAARILQGLCSPQELKGHVMTACQLVEPGMGYAGIAAANTGMSSPDLRSQRCLNNHSTVCALLC